MMVKAPNVTELIVDLVSANFIRIKWDNVGENFYYAIEISDSIGNFTNWKRLGSTRQNEYFIDDLERGRTYQLRISATGQHFTTSGYTYTDQIKMFEDNHYIFTKLNELTLSDKFINEKFTKDNRGYIDFNRDAIYASLMNSDFKFSTIYESVNNVKGWILKRHEYHELLSNVRPLCKDINRVMMGYTGDVVYVMERHQNTARVSNDKGKTWFLLKLTDGRIGNPVSDSVFVQNDTTSYILGLDYVYYGRTSNNVRWSSTEHRFSTTDISFTKMDEQLSLGFDVEIFNKLSALPPNMFDRAESIVATNNRVYVSGLNELRYINLEDDYYEDDGPDAGLRKFDPEVIEITPDELSVVKKMESTDDNVIILVSGKLRKKGVDPTKPENVIDSEYKGIYVYDGTTLKRVFGNTPEERYFIEHEYTDISRDSDEVFISVSDFKLTDIVDYDGKDGNPMSKFLFDRGYISDAVIPKTSFRAKLSNLDKWDLGFMKFFDEPYFNYMRKGGERVWLNQDKRIGIVNPELEFTNLVDESGLDTPERINKEQWIDGEVYIDINDISFRDFKDYANGVLLYRNTGEIIGYYQFPYKRISEVDIKWRPLNQLLYAKLIGSYREQKEVEDKLNRLNDPDLLPLLDKFIPKNYYEGDDEYMKCFLEAFLKVISHDRDSNYKSLLNVIRNKMPLETDYNDYLNTEMYKRNIYVDQKKKEDVIRFFESRKSDFYSARGTEASYKFLFKLLYNEDVEIDSEYVNVEYYITVESDTLDDEVVGLDLSTDTGKSYITGIDRVYDNGKLLWEISINGMIGEYITGQEFFIEGTSYTGKILVNIKGKELLYNDIDYINRGKSYYIMRIKSGMPVNMYRDDLFRFVHPYGIPFKGILDMVVMLRTGDTMKHSETILKKYYNARIDSGSPIYYPNVIGVLDSKGDLVFDDFIGWYKTKNNPLKGMMLEIDEDEYNKENGFVGDPNNESFTNYKEYINNVSPYKRRKPYSATFDMTMAFWTNFRSAMELGIEKRLLEWKGNVGNPRDPKKPNFIKYKENENE